MKPRETIASGEEFCGWNSTFKALLSAWSELARCQPASRKNRHPKLAHNGETEKKEQMRGRTLFASKQKSDAVAHYDDFMITFRVLN